MKFYKFWINPITVYSLPWLIMTILYELKLVYYYDLTIITWIVIIIFQFIYNLGCVFPKILATITHNKQLKKQIKSSFREEKKLKMMIIILSALTLVSSLVNYLSVAKRYGPNLLLYVSQLYSARLEGDITTVIPYLGALVYPAIIYSGFYVKEYGFKTFIILPIVSWLLDSLTGGGRLGIFTGMFLFLVPLLLKKEREAEQLIKKRKLANFKDVIIIFVLLAIIAYIFWFITKVRSLGISYNSYMSPTMIKLVNYEPAIYKIYTYIASPLGVLNEFLKSPDFKFGGHTFLTVYSLLNKLGINVEFSKYQKFYYVPISCNVGTYIRELIEDFTIFPALIVTFITGLIYSYNYLRFMHSESYINLIWTSILTYIVFFSFFMWQFRSSSMWISTIVGVISAVILTSKIVLTSKNNYYVGDNV